MPIESVMPSSHLIFHCPLLLLPPIPPSIRVFSNESTLRMRWPKYWSFSLTWKSCHMLSREKIMQQLLARVTQLCINYKNIINLLHVNKYKENTVIIFGCWNYLVLTLFPNLPFLYCKHALLGNHSKPGQQNRAIK